MLSKVLAQPVLTSILAVCTANALWGQNLEPVGSTNFSSMIWSNPSGDFKLTEDIYITTSPWIPLPIFMGTLNGQGRFIYGLAIQENTPDTYTGLFRHLTGVVREIEFVDPQIETRADGVRAGLVAGLNDDRVSDIVWRGGGWKTLVVQY